MATFYAVGVGRRTGIYQNWKACENQVKGFEGAKFKKFSSLGEAQNFLKLHSFNTGVQQKGLKTGAGSTASFFYAVGVGRKTGVYGSWKECEPLVKGVDGAKFKKFRTKEEADAFVKLHSGGVGAKRGLPSQWPNPNGKRQRASQAASTVYTGIGSMVECKGPKVSQAVSASQSKEQKLTGLKEDIGDHVPIAVHSAHHCWSHVAGPGSKATIDWKPSALQLQEGIRVYIDGSHKGVKAKKGESIAGKGRAGCGAYAGPSCPLNISEGLPNEWGPGSNQRAEIAAPVLFLSKLFSTTWWRDAHSSRENQIETPVLKIIFMTDSKYVMKAVDSWMFGWNRKKWDNTVIGIQNLGLFHILWQQLELDKAGNQRSVATEFRHVKGHSGDFGNEMADRLANAGADLRNSPSSHDHGMTCEQSFTIQTANEGEQRFEMSAVLPNGSFVQQKIPYLNKEEAAKTQKSRVK